MPRVINYNCIGCGACASTCPADAIFEGEDHYQVDQEACIDCGVCEIGCAANAITEV